MNYADMILIQLIPKQIDNAFLILLNVASLVET